MTRRLSVLFVSLCLLFGAVAFAVDLNYLGSFEPPREGWVFEGTNVGEISGLTLSEDGTFFAIGDDRGENVDPPGVLYELRIDLDEGGIHGVDVVSVVQLKTPDGQPYGTDTLDGEDVLWTPNGFIVSSERDLENKPWVRMFSRNGEFLSEVPIPEKFIPLFEGEEQVRGVRKNLSFEASALTPDAATLYVMNEQALVQDGETSTPEAGTPVRLIEYDLSGDEPVVVGEYVYVTEPMFATPPEGKSGDNGVPGMVYVGHITPEIDLIVMERSYVSGAGNQIGLFGVKLDPYVYNRENIMALDALADPENPYTGFTLKKFPLLIISDDPELTEVPFDPDNMEAIALGPQLSNGNYTLIIAADNNFNPKYQRNAFAAFEIVPDNVAFSVVLLGCGGGPREDNLSGFMYFPGGSPEEAIVIDPGTLTVGIRRADELGNLWDFRVPVDSNQTREGFVFQNLNAHLITHAHLDHVAAGYINGPVDVYGGHKPIMAIQSVINYISDYIYNWNTWPDFAALGYYDYVVFEPGLETPIPSTSMTVEAYPVSHGAPYESTAFLIKANGYYILHFGDAGPEGVEGTGLITAVWERVAPLIAEGKLVGMFLEVAYAEGRPDNLLFGHLTPSWMMAELHYLANLVNPMEPYQALEGLKIVVTHIKPVFQMVEQPASLIARQLDQLNDVGVEFIIPYQGMRIDFRPLD